MMIQYKWREKKKRENRLGRGGGTRGKIKTKQQNEKREIMITQSGGKNAKSTTPRTNRSLDSK
jgi:hypothetical protein